MFLLDLSRSKDAGGSKSKPQAIEVIVGIFQITALHFGLCTYRIRMWMLVECLISYGAFEVGRKTVTISGQDILLCESKR